MPFKRPLVNIDQNQVAPNFVRPLQDKRALAGQEVILECRLEGCPEPVIKWLKDGQNVTQCPDYLLERDGNRYLLIVPCAQIVDSGRFTCQAVNAAGSKATTCMLIVAPAPSPLPGRSSATNYSIIKSPAPPATPIGPAAPYFVKELQNEPLKLGIDAMLECRVVGNPTPDVEWYKDDNIKLSTGNRYKLEYDRQTGICSLIVAMMRNEDAAEYTCMATNNRGVAKTSAYLLPKSEYEDWLHDQQSRLTSERRIYMMQSSRNYASSVASGTQSSGPDMMVTERKHFFRSIEGNMADRGGRDSQINDENLHVRRQDPHLQPNAEYSPRISNILKNLRLQEGEDAIFVSLLDGNPKPTIKWLKNGVPIYATSHHLISYKDGEAQLHIRQVTRQDIGVYCIEARNKVGTASTQASLQVDVSNARPYDVESFERAIEDEYVSGRTGRRPQILKPMNDVTVKEHQTARFEVKVAGEPQPTIRWTKDGRTLISDGEKLRTSSYDDGWSTLALSNVDYADRGIYTCTAANRVGEVQCSAELIVQTSVLPVMPVHPTPLSPIRPVPSSQPAMSYERENIQAILLTEGESVTLRCKATGHHNATVAWTKNDILLVPGKTKYKIDLGFEETTLIITNAQPDDSGIYQCIVTSSYGTTSIKGQVIVEQRHTPSAPSRNEMVTTESVIGYDTRGSVASTPFGFSAQHPSSNDRIQSFASSISEVVRQTEKHYDRTEEPQISIREPPRFIQRFSESVKLREGANCRLDCKFIPTNDPRMEIVWLYNNKPIHASARTKSRSQCGFASLEISGLQPEDSGLYICCARNASGEDRISTQLTVFEEQRILTEAQHPRSIREISNMEYRRHTPVSILPDTTVSRERPRFAKSQLQNVEVPESAPVHFECKVAPSDDANLKIEWFHKGAPLMMGSRIKVKNDFGFVSLDIAQAIPQDSGVYTCRAVNPLGSAEIHGNLSCYPVIEKRIEPKPAPQKILVEPEEAEIFDAPHFLYEIKDLQVLEGKKAYFETKLEPHDDPNLKIEWLKDNMPLKMANRIQIINDFGLVALRIDPTILEDQAVYTCFAYNRQGRAQTSARLSCVKESRMLLQSQNPQTWGAIRHLESPKPAPKFEPIERFCEGPPVLSHNWADQRLKEGAVFRLESRVEPANDPTMSVDWLFNGCPLNITGSRLTNVFEFGHISFILKDLIVQDAGQYTLLVRNQLGQTSASCNLQVIPESSVQTGTQHAESLGSIRYLESQDRRGKQEDFEKETKAPPSFVINLQPSVQNLTEGDSLHLEGKISSAYDDSLTVQWYHNDNIVQTGSRFKMFHEFGLVSLDITTVYPEDSGIYTCYAKNSLGEAYSQSKISCSGKEAIITQTDHPQSLKEIKRLEAPKPTQPEEIESVKQAPVFSQPLKDVSNIKEGEKVLLECHVLPTDDPELAIEWFFDDNPLQSGHRFQTSHDFGYVALTILYAYPEDTGIFTCLAKNGAGTAETQCRVTCYSQKSMILESCHPDSLNTIRRLETPRAKPPDMAEHRRPAPIFVTNPRSYDNLIEGQTCHLECHVRPTDDPSLNVQWYKDGQLLQASHRFKHVQNFGYVAFDFLQVYPEDSGRYSCVAYNDIGSAETYCSIKCYPLANLYLDTEHPESLRRIQILEQPGQKPSQESEPPKIAPRFVQELTGPEGYLTEGQTVHLQCRYEPNSDPSLKLEWLFNNQPMIHGSRFRTVNDFGYVSLDILNVIPEDTGLYTVKIVNDLGEAATNFDMECRSIKSLYLDPQNEQSLRQIRDLENRQYIRPASPELHFPKPNFLFPLQNFDNAVEGSFICLETKLHPTGDPSMRLQWYHNENPLSEGSRFQTKFDFDTVSLKILTTYPEDSGVYSCKATNNAGECAVSCLIKCKATRSILSETQNEESLHRIHDLENRTRPKPVEPEIEICPPKFIVPLGPNFTLNEGESVHLECNLVPKNDPNISIQWFLNGHPLVSGHRFRTLHDFGLVVLDILYAFPEDTGNWTCRAQNHLGVDETSTNIRIFGKETLLLCTQHPESLKQIRQLEAPKVQQAPAEQSPRGPPRFTSDLKSLVRYEGQSAHFETRLTPADDDRMIVEWYQNDHPMASGNRFKSTCDFGYVSMDIGQVSTEDEGVYYVRAYNDQGETYLQAELTVHPRPSLLLETQHPESLAKIRALEAPHGRNIDDAELENVSPYFVVQLNSCLDLVEGQPAHFEAQVQPTTDNKLRIEWYHNGRQLQDGSRFNMKHDFGLVVLDISGCIAEDSGAYICRAINEMGQAQTSADLICKARGSIYRDTMHEASLARIREIEAPKMPARLEPAVPKQKPVFVESLPTLAPIAENENVSILCRVKPMDDPDLEIQWFHNGRPLLHSNRISLGHDFGLVTLNLTGASAQDSGLYVCKATNRLGSDHTETTLNILTGDRLILGTIHPNSYKQTQYLESLDKFPKTEMPDKKFQAPAILIPLKSAENLKEGDKVRLECQISPPDDPNLKVDWFFNDNPLPEASRFKWQNDFGFVVFDIDHLYPEDSGIYTCKISNDHGAACTSACLKVEGFESIQRRTQHPESWQRIQDLERPVERFEQEIPVSKTKPRILKQSPHMEGVPEDASVSMEVYFEPANDDSINWQWFHNGQPIMAGQLVKVSCELGRAVVQIVKTNADHTGVYTFKVSNELGEAAASIVLKVAAGLAVLTDTQHQSSLALIRQLEAPKPAPQAEPETIFGPPIVVQPLINVSAEEGEPCRFECQYQPANDPSLKVEWLNNGEILKSGSKYKIGQDFGFATLDILYTYPEDSGIFVCRITNDDGQILTSGVLRCAAKESIIFSTTNPESVQKIIALETPRRVASEKPDLEKPAPVFLKQLINYGQIPEGSSVHFETLVEPKDDPDLKITWLHNDIEVVASSRFKMLHDFGFVILDIIQAEPRDSGVWTCKARNRRGQATGSGSFECLKRPTIICDTSHPDSVMKIIELETPKPAPLTVEPSIRQAPNFVHRLPPNLSLEEHDSVHLEAKIDPINDPDMEIGWYKDGVPITHGNRFILTNDFGFCILDILSLIPEDNGIYTCIAKNRLGSDATSVQIDCSPKAPLILEPQVGSTQQKAIYDLELSLGRPRVLEVGEVERVAPKFLQHLRTTQDLVEGDHAYFSAKLNQTFSPDLKIEWFLNGKPLVIGSRMKTISDFGFVVLEIVPVYAEDSGEYACVASNDSGSDRTIGLLTCQPKVSIISQSQLPDRMSGAKAKIDILEAPKPQMPDKPDQDFSAPIFQTHLGDLGEFQDGQLVHFECKVEPAADPNMKIEWFHNDKPLFHSSRVKMINDFGFVILEIAPVEPHDSGVYRCVARNFKGSAQSEGKISVQRGGVVSYAWQLPEKAQQDKIVELEDYLHRDKEPPPAAEKQFGPPTIVEPLKDLGEISENSIVHFQCQIEPIDDPNLKVQWFHNGKVLPFSSRIRTQNDFGFVVLDIKQTIPEDSGNYLCRVINKSGQAETVGQLMCKSTVQYQPPYFTVPLPNEISGIQQFDTVHMECRVGPLTDPNLEIFWLFNDQPLITGSRFVTVNDFGYVSLDILQAIPENSGRYTCVAENGAGRVQCSCDVRVATSPAVICERQAPGQSIEDLRRRLGQYTNMQISLTEDDFYKDSRVQKPRLVSRIQNVSTNEGEFARFECQCAPINDPKLEIEWFKNGAPITIGHRFLSIHDFGYVSLVLLYALPYDTGEYTVKATNAAGSDECKAMLVCSPKASVITSAQIPQGVFVANISKEADQTLYWNQYADFDSEPKEKCAPFFTVQPRRVQTYENEPARFECAVQGNPKPKGSRYKLSYDGMHYLVVPHVQPQDAGEIVCVAKNSEGESRITVTLDVFVVHDFRFHKLRTMDDSNRSLDAQMQREYTWRREAMGVLGDVFDKGPKADYHKIMRAENARPTIASLESDELLRKFDRKKESAFYDNISLVEQPKQQIQEAGVQYIRLKPAQIVKRDLPKEELEKVELKTTQKSQSVSGQADKAPSWQNQLSNKPIMTEKQEQQKFKIRPPVVKAEDVPAKDQVQLKTVKPKGPEQETHVVLERAPEKTGDQWNVAQKVSEPEQKEQIQLKPAFQPKIVAGEQVQVKMEQVHLKDTPLDDKKERPHDEVPVVKTTILMKSSKKQPSLIQGLSSQTVEVGKPCLFTCKFDGDQPIDVLWSKDGRILGSTFEYQIKTIADESKLEISKVKHSHRGQYCVKIGNMAGSIDSNAYLTVIDKHDDTIVPKFVSILKDQYDAASGDKMSLSVQVIGRPQVLWFKDGKQLMREPRYDFLIQGDRHELIICDVLPQDSGIYECIVRNVKGEDRCRTNVKVYMSKSTPKLKIQVDESKQASKVLPSPEVKSYAPAPAFVEQLKPQHVQEGQTAKFSAKLNVPATAIKWCFDDRELKPNKFRLVATHTCENLSLEIRNISKKDEGKYTCEVTNESGTASSTANLQVLAKGTQLVTPTFAQGVHQSIQAPSFTKPLQSQTAKLGGKVELICGISGSPLPTIKWSVNDREIVFDNNVKAQTNVSEARLIIERVGSQHFGQYKCSIANKSGLAECSADLKQDSSSTRTAPPWLTRK